MIDIHNWRIMLAFQLPAGTFATYFSQIFAIFEEKFDDFGTILMFWRRILQKSSSESHFRILKSMSENPFQNLKSNAENPKP